MVSNIQGVSASNFNILILFYSLVMEYADNGDVF